MTIVCGTDFSPESRRAARVAARLAQRLGDGLLLVHVLKRPADRPTAETTLQSTASELGVPELAVTTRIVPRRADNAPHEAVLDVAREVSASMIAVGSHGRGAASRLILGSVAERTLLLADRPVVVVRGAGEGFEAWAHGHRAPRLLVPVDLREGTDRVLGLARAWRERMACDITFLHLYWPLEEARRLGLDGKPPAEHELEVARILEGQLQAKVGQIPGEGRQELRLRGFLSGAAEFIILESDRAEADFIVVGVRRRKGMESFWEGSTAVGIVRAARVPVVCVPLGERTTPA